MSVDILSLSGLKHTADLPCSEISTIDRTYIFRYIYHKMEAVRL